MKFLKKISFLTYTTILLFSCKKDQDAASTTIWEEIKSNCPVRGID